LLDRLGQRTNGLHIDVLNRPLVASHCPVIVDLISNSEQLLVVTLLLSWPQRALFLIAAAITCRAKKNLKRMTSQNLRQRTESSSGK
jgi:hypothetical protein